MWSGAVEPASVTVVQADLDSPVFIAPTTNNNNNNIMISLRNEDKSKNNNTLTLFYTG